MIKAYYLNGTALNLESNDPAHRKKVTSMQYVGNVMSEDYVKMTVISTEEILFGQRMYIVFDERLYFLNKLPKAKMTGRNMYEYELEWEGGMYELSRARFDMSSIAQVYGFDLSGDLKAFCNIIIATMNKINGNGSMWALDFEQESGSDVATDEKMLTYEDENCLAVIQDLVTQWPEWEWKVVVENGDIGNNGYVGGVLKMRRKKAGSRFVGTSHSMSYGRKGGITSIEKTAFRNESDCNRIYFYGSNRNVFGNYKSTRVCLPSSQDASDSYMQRNLAPSAGIYERTEIVDGIYPGNRPFTIARYGGVQEVTASSTSANVSGSTLVLGSGQQEKKVFEFDVYDGTADPSTGQLVGTRDFFRLFGKWLPRTQTSIWGCDYAEWRLMYGAGDTSANRTRYDTYYVGKSCYIATEKPTVTFQTGDCAGMTFTIWNGYTDVNEDGEAICTIACFCQDASPENLDSNIQVAQLEAVQVPNGLIHPSAGDKFIIDGIYMPPRYLYYAGAGDTFSAEGQLKDYADAYMAATANMKDFSIGISDEWVYRKMKADTSFGIRLFDTISINDTDFMEEFEGANIRVVSVNYDILKQSYKVKLSLYYGDSELKLIRDYLRRLR